MMHNLSFPVLNEATIINDTSNLIVLDFGLSWVAPNLTKLHFKSVPISFTSSTFAKLEELTIVARDLIPDDLNALRETAPRLSNLTLDHTSLGFKLLLHTFAWDVTGALTVYLPSLRSLKLVEEHSILVETILNNMDVPNLERLELVDTALPASNKLQPTRTFPQVRELCFRNTSAVGFPEEYDGHFFAHVPNAVSFVLHHDEADVSSIVRCIAAHPVVLPSMTTMSVIAPLNDYAALAHFVEQRTQRGGQLKELKLGRRAYDGIAEELKRSFADGRLKITLADETYTV